MFNIPEPTTWLCRVWEYSKGHSILTVRIYQNDTNIVYQAGFEGVEYFEGPMIWKSADFKIGSPEECIALIQQIGIYPELPREYLSGKLSLFEVETVGPESRFRGVRILALSSSLSQVSGSFNELATPSNS